MNIQSENNKPNKPIESRNDIGKGPVIRDSYGREALVLQLSMISLTYQQAQWVHNRQYTQ